MDNATQTELNALQVLVMKTLPEVLDQIEEAEKLMESIESKQLISSIKRIYSDGNIESLEMVNHSVETNLF